MSLRHGLTDMASKTQKQAGRKRSNYGVSIYQEAPVVVQRKRKATEISIFENGVRVRGIPGQAPAAASASASATQGGLSWGQLDLNTSDMSSLKEVQQGVLHQGLQQHQPLVLGHSFARRTTTQMDGLPMRRTRSSQQKTLLDELPPPPAFRPTVSGIAEVLGVDEPLHLPMRRSRSRSVADVPAMPPAPAFRPTFSGLEEAFTSDDSSFASGSHARALLPLPPVFRPTVSGLQEAFLEEHAPQKGIPMRRTRSYGVANAEVPAALPMQQSVSGILNNLLGEGNDLVDSLFSDES